MEQGRIAARVAVGAIAKEPPKSFPYGIYAVPEISTCGLTEEEVKERGIPYERGIARFRETSRGHIMGLDSGLLKLIFSLKTRRLLGVHIVGEGATELVHIGQAVLNLKGTVEYFVENTFNYPTPCRSLQDCPASMPATGWARSRRRCEPRSRALHGDHQTAFHIQHR